MGEKNCLKSKAKLIFSLQKRSKIRIDFYGKKN